MAHHGSFSSSQGSQGSTPASTTGSASGVAPITTATFSVFQEGPNQPLVFAPPVGTPELQSLIDLFIALDVPASMKMELIQRDFEAHTQRTNERYKTYVVNVPTANGFTSSPSPIFHNAFESAYRSGTGNGSGSSNSYMEMASAAGPSPSNSDLTDPLFLSMPMFPGQLVGDYPVVAAAETSPLILPSWMTTAPVSSLPPVTASPPSRAVSRHYRHQNQPHRWQQRRPSRQPDSSMQIVTRDGEDVTHMSSRATRTHEERESTRIVRQRGACADCRRKKTRCDPSHMGNMLHSVNRPAPYGVPAQSGRAKEEAAAAQAAQAAKDKAEGKKPMTTVDPVIVSPQAPTAPVAEATGPATTVHDVSTLGWDMLQDSFDWTELSGQGSLFSDEELNRELSLSIEDTFGDSLYPAPSVQDTSAGLALASSSRVQPRTTRFPTQPPTIEQSVRGALTSGPEAYFGDGVICLSEVPIPPPVSPHVPLESSMSGVTQPISAADLGSQPSLGSEWLSPDTLSLSSAQLFSVSEPTASASGSLATEEDEGTGQDGEGEGRNQEHGLGQSRAVHTPEQSPNRHRRMSPSSPQDGGARVDDSLGGSGSSGEAVIANHPPSLQESDLRSVSAAGTSMEDGHAAHHDTEQGQSSTSRRTTPIATTATMTRNTSRLSNALQASSSSSLEEASDPEPQAASQTDIETSVAAGAREDATVAAPVDVGALYAFLSEIVTSLAPSLIPSLLVWSASQAPDTTVSEISRGMERMHFGGSLVACQ